MQDHDHITAYITHLTLRGLSPRYTAATRRTLARVAAALPVPLADADGADLLAWRTALTAGPATIGIYVSCVRGFYAWALDTGIVTGDPAAAVPVPKRPQLLPRPIAEDRLLDALARAPRRIRLCIVLAAWAGLRACEIACLRVECIVPGTSPYLIITADATKGSRERIVPLSGFVMAEIAAAGLPRRGWAFPRRDGRAGPCQPWMISHLCNDHLHGCGYPDTLHSLRHRFGTLTCRSEGLRTTMGLMGHRHPSSTVIYVAFSDPSGRAAVESLPVPRKARRLQERKAS